MDFHGFGCVITEGEKKKKKTTQKFISWKHNLDVLEKGTVITGSAVGVLCLSL